MLFKKTDKLLEYAELTTVNFTSVKATIKMVEQQHLVPILGKELYQSLNDAYTAEADESELEDALKLLLDKCRSVIGPYLCYYYTPKAEVKLSDAGAQRQESTTNKTAYQNQVNNFREQNLREAEQATELLLEFLEDNKNDYQEWIDSQAFTEYRSLFIKSGSEFDKLFTSASPCRNYWAMRATMKDVEENNIRTIIGDTLFAALKEKDTEAEPDFAEKEKDLIYKIKKVTAYLTVCFAIPFLNVRLDGNGITVMAVNGAQNDAVASRSAAGNSALNIIIEKCEAAAKSWTNNLIDFLNKNATEFEGWPLEAATSTENAPAETSGNEELTGSFGMV